MDRTGKRSRMDRWMDRWTEVDKVDGSGQTGGRIGGIDG